jgi:hypothetical protein
MKRPFLIVKGKTWAVYVVAALIGLGAAVVVSEFLKLTRRFVFGLEWSNPVTSCWRLMFSRQNKVQRRSRSFKEVQSPSRGTKVTERSRGSRMIDDNRLEDRIGGVVFLVGAIGVATWELEQKKPGARDTFLALLDELQSTVRQLPISGRPDDTLDLSRLPDWAKATLDRSFAALLRCVLRVPASESETHAWSASEATVDK